MKVYKLIALNNSLHLTRTNDLREAEDNLNAWIADGWNLQQIVSPNDLGGAMIAVLWQEE